MVGARVARIQCERALEARLRGRPFEALHPDERKRRVRLRQRRVQLERARGGGRCRFVSIRRRGESIDAEERICVREPGVRARVVLLALDRLVEVPDAQPEPFVGACIPVLAAAQI